MAAGVFIAGTGAFDTVVTSICDKSSRLRFFSESGLVCGGESERANEAKTNSVEST